MASKIELAYLAGVIDSDGTIGVKKSTYAMRVRGDAGQPVYAERICCKQVEPEAVNLLHKAFGGCLYLQRPSAKGGRQLYSWAVHSKAAGVALKAMLPYLRIKKRQAQNALALRSIIGQGRGWTFPKIVRGEPLVTAAEFAAMSGNSKSAVFQSARLGSIPSIKRGRSRMIPVSYLAAYKARMAGSGRAPRSQDVTNEMERFYLRAKELNRVGA